MLFDLHPSILYPKETVQTFCEVLLSNIGEAALRPRAGTMHNLFMRGLTLGSVSVLNLEAWFGGI